MSIRKDHKITGTGVSDWNTLTNKPSAFPAMQHDHPMDEVSGLSEWAATMMASIPDSLSELEDDVGFMKSTDTIDYSSLANLPAIPSAQVSSDWASTTSPTQILNKPALFSGKYADLTDKPVLAPVSLSGAYDDLTGRPAIPTLPILSTVATSGLYADLIGKPTIPTVTYPVTSVNTKTGAVVLTNTDVGAAAASHTHSIANITGLQTALDSKLNSASIKRQETYSGVTDASGNYTVVFATPFSVAPNIQAQVVNGSHNTSMRVAAVSTTGFTIAVGTRAGLTVLGLTVLGFDVPATAGVAVDVLVTSK